MLHWSTGHSTRYPCRNAASSLDTETRGPEATGETVGVARLVRENEHEGEFAVIVQADMKGKGVARHLMRRLIEWARRTGLREVVGQVLADNAPMLAFVRHLGFSVKRMPDEPDVVEARLSLE